ncbi:MAG: tetratricopeptide repeat protein, partial [Nostocaceae cyanobacterium]|nr:tetratricopeptide repeat protein [Nostocaceae cyanobacterium]
SDTNIGIQVKSCQCWNNQFVDKVRWSLTEEEIKKNSVLVCILIKGKLEDDQAKSFNLIFAGFLPTNMMKTTYGKCSVGINELLYGGGLHNYLTGLVSPKNNNSQELLDYTSWGSLCYQKGDYLEAINNYNHALKTNLNLVKTYYCRGLAYLALQDKQQSIKDFTDAIKIDSNFAPAYYNRGLVYCYIEKREVAIADFTEAIKINPNYVAAYIHRGQTLVQIGEKQGALADFQKVADLYLKQGRQADYQNTLNTITKLLHSSSC